MNDQTIALIRELAAKLGTTTEHLWGVLIAQARVEFLANSVAYLMIPLFCAIAFFFYKKDKESPEDRLGFTPYFFPMAISVCFAVITLVVGMIHFPMYLASILNPEYWALKQILK